MTRRGTAEPFADRLLAWFDRHGRHDLPWQHPRTPYRVWVSEIMLQQTQVTTVIAYFERFVARFPDLASLAEAEQDEVLALWSGLGYYARGRNLHRAARECKKRFRGNVPDSLEQLLSLPGIGESTANAILSQAWDRPAVVLDGNVRRVIARHAAIPGWPGKPAVHRRLAEVAERYLPSDRGADYSQAIMDLGATVCTSRTPACDDCPVRTDCQARRSGSVGDFPGRKPDVRVREESWSLLLVTDEDGRVLLQRRPETGIWGGLWSLPEGTDPAAVPLERRRHRLTHRLLHLDVARLDGIDAATPGDGRAWFSADQWRDLGLPRPIRGILESHCHEEPK